MTDRTLDEQQEQATADGDKIYLGIQPEDWSVYNDELIDKPLREITLTEPD